MTRTKKRRVRDLLEARAVVTDHVIVRWLERVEGYDFGDIREELRETNGDRPVEDYEILDYLQEKFGLFRGHVIYKILTKETKMAIKLGATRYRRGKHTLIINNGRIVTLTTKGM